MKSAVVVGLFVLVCVAVSGFCEVQPKSYPLFKQCDPRWGNDLIQTQTVCEVGCLMSSVSMALNGYGVHVPANSATEANPGTLNSWLRSHGGYVGDNDLDEAVVAKLDPARITYEGEYTPGTAISMASIKKMLDAKKVVIANVMDGHHFVLVVGYDESATTLYVNDPGFDRTTYSYSADVVGWRIYAVKN